MTYSAYIYYKSGIYDPLVVASDQEMDAFLDKLLAESWENTVAAIRVREGSRTDDESAPAVLNVGVDAGREVGSLIFNGNGRIWASKGQESRPPVVFYYAGHDMEFASDSEIPLDDIRVALREFLETGGARPSSVTWREWPEGHVAG